MRLYTTPTSPYGRVVRMVIIAKDLGDRVEVLPAETRKADSPYYAINPSGRVPYLVRDDGIGMEDSQLIALYLDSLDGKPRLTPGLSHQGWAYGRLETNARSMLDGISVFLREMRRPENERSPTILRHEQERAARLAVHWEREIGHPLMQGPLNMAQLLLITALDTGAACRIAVLESGKPKLSVWTRRMRELAPVKITAAKD